MGLFCDTQKGECETPSTVLGSCDLLDTTQAFKDQENRCAPRVISYNAYLEAQCTKGVYMPRGRALYLKMSACDRM